jgi:hypothetical protein
VARNCGLSQLAASADTSYRLQQGISSPKTLDNQILDNYSRRQARFDASLTRIKGLTFVEDDDKPSWAQKVARENWTRG